VIMSSANDDTTTFTDVEASQEASALQSVGGADRKSVPSPLNKDNELRVDHLKSLSKEDFNRLLEKKKSVEAEVTRSFAEEAISPGIYRVDGQTYWVCPKAFFSEDNIIGQMIVSFAYMTGADIKEISAPVNTTKFLDKKFIIGIWFGMESSTNQKRRRGKQSYELGRTCSFSLIVKNRFRRTRELGEQALCRDNFFFGNNEGEVINKTKVQFHIKTALRSYFDDRKWGDLIFGIINYTADFVGFTYLTEAEQEKVIADHILPVDQLFTSCYPSTTLKRGKQVILKTKKPNPIRQSPLYLRTEMELITRISNPIFVEYVDIANNYIQDIFAIGFDALKAQIRETIRVRWETLQRFSNRTKLRLQVIRKITNNPTLKKANVVQDQVNNLLRSYQNPVLNLVSDIKHITGHTSLKDIMTAAFKKEFDSDAIATGYLIKIVTDLYMKIEVDSESIKGLKEIKLPKEPSDLDYDKALKAYIKIQNNIGELKHLTSSLQSIKVFRVFSRTEQSKNLIKNILTYVKIFKEIPKNAQDIACKLISESKYKDSKLYLTDIERSLNDSLAIILNICIAKERFKEPESVQNAFKLLKNAILDLGYSSDRGLLLE